ncbi:NTP/NDP exchange transporter [Emcibacter nanhaiensis]|uniref:MFS transporter n=1 Tax=Emcibacter nanhaiensis TaxID=1505037 RepID=A0A501PNY1_9PROT|nr:MFS transporter [Emcibacter nanhaiensis]TPD61694.1 MFS transporter [Emcibacter nanhaiensis]
MDISGTGQQTRLIPVLNIRAGELPAVLLAFGYFFCLLCSYYILRPMRDEMAIASGVENMQWLFTGTFFAMLAVTPLFGFLASRFLRKQIIPVTYGFFLVNILVFYALFQAELTSPWVARGFFWWVSVFNFFVVSVFWAYMSDIFSAEQGKRLFGIIAAGGSIGAITGPVLTQSLVTHLGTANLLLVSAAFLFLALVCMLALLRHEQDVEEFHVSKADRKLGGSWLEGLLAIFRSRYMAGIAAWILLSTLAATFLYFQQAVIIRDAFDSPEERIRMFARIDLAVNGLTLLTQIFIVGRLMGRFGVSLTLALFPLVTLMGFAALAAAPVLLVVVGFQATQRAVNFAIAQPGYRVLYTTVSDGEKYKAQPFIDTVGVRGGDAASGWIYASLAQGLGWGLQPLALFILPIAGIWAILSIRLGRIHEQKLETSEETSP